VTFEASKQIAWRKLNNGITSVHDFLIHSTLLQFLAAAVGDGENTNSQHMKKERELTGWSSIYLNFFSTHERFSGVLVQQKLRILTGTRHRE
jgi:hypothetical protein